MSPTPVFLSLLLFAATASAADLRFVPPNPTSRTPVTAHITFKSGCPPSTGRNGTGIEIEFSPCATTATDPSDFAIDLGALPAGVYHVDVEFGSTDGTPVAGFGIADGTLTVQDAAPPFQVTPNVGYPGDTVTISGATGNDVKFGGKSATIISSTANQVVVRAPGFLPMSVVDVTVADVRSAIAFYYLPVLNPLDPDPAFMEPVLFPVVYTGPGALGSSWQTDLSMRNENDYPLEVGYQWWVACFPECDDRPQAHTSLLVSYRQWPQGWVTWVPRQAAPKVHFNILARDLTQQANALGTEIPVVREKDFYDRTLQLLNVPTDSRFRAALRAYDLGTPTSLRLQIFTMNGNDPIVSTFLFPARENPSFSFAIIADLVAAYPELAGKGPLRIAIDPPVPGAATLWAFVSVTNNETQHVTTISPQ